MSKRIIKIGILLDSYDAYAWLFNSIERVVNLEFVEISVLIFCDSRDTRKSGLSKFWGNKNKIVYNIFNKLDQFLFRKILFRGKPNAFEKKNLKKILPDSPIINIKPIRKKYSDYFAVNDVEKIRSFNLDIIIRLSRERILRGDILSCSKYGIWSDHHADNHINRGGPPGFWEIIENVPQTGSILQILTEELDGGRVLYRSWSSTYPYSPAWNRNLFYWTSSSFLSRQIELIHKIQVNKFFNIIEYLYNDDGFYSHRLFKTPHNFESIKLFAIYIRKIVFRIFQKLSYHNNSYLLYDYSTGFNASIRKFKKIIPPKDRNWSDPNLINKNGTYYIFVSEYMRQKKKSHISVIELDGNRNFKLAVPVLEKNSSLTYPFVFEWEEKYYMIPQSESTGTIDLYECIDFPNKWKFKMKLMENIRAVNPTILHYKNRWWIFVGLSENEISSPGDELFIFYSDELLTNKWSPHLLNPVISDVRRARPAGRMFIHNSNLYRPSRNGSIWHEHSIDINKITTITENEYYEERVNTITPNWDEQVKSTHTIAFHDEITILDAFIMKRRYL